jgi:signal transduction histidine kinase
MKNSISVLSGTLERLLDDASPETEQAYPQMAQMLYQTRRLNDSLMQLLALYKHVGTPAYPFDVQPIEAGQLVEQVVALERVLLESRAITLDLDVDPGLVWHVDEDLIVGVVSHAINNAVHYTRDRIRLSAREHDGWLEIRVEDNGRGYPAALLEAGSAALSGTASGVNFLTNSAGLGLHFSREVAKMHRHRERVGTVRLENGGALGGGCFILALP